MLTETEIRSLRQEAADLERQSESLNAEARNMKASMEDEGVDPIRDREAFDKLDSKWREADTKAEEAAELRSRVNRALERTGDAQEPQTRDRNTEGMSLGERAVESRDYQEAAKLVKRDRGQFVSRFGSVEIASRDEAKRIIQARAVDSGALVQPDRLPGIAEPNVYRPVKAVDLLTVVDTDTDSIDYVAETAPTENVDDVPYGTDPATAGSLPESSYGFTEKTVSVKRVGHYTPATEAQIADAAQFRSLIDGRLRGGVRRKLEALVVSGSTAGGDAFDGIVNTAGIASYPRDTAGGESRHDAAHKAITLVRINSEEEPTAIGIHPNDFEQYALEKDANGNYLNGRGVNEPATIWGLRPVVSTVFPEGNPVVGDFSGAWLWMREGIAVTASESHSDWFLKGWVAIKAQMRGAFAVVRPVLFAEVTSF